MEPLFELAAHHRAAAPADVGLEQLKPGNAQPQAPAMFQCRQPDDAEARFGKVEQARLGPRALALADITRERNRRAAGAHAVQLDVFLVRPVAHYEACYKPSVFTR